MEETGIALTYQQCLLTIRTEFTSPISRQSCRKRPNNDNDAKLSKHAPSMQINIIGLYWTKAVNISKKRCCISMGQMKFNSKKRNKTHNEEYSFVLARQQWVAGLVVVPA